MENKTGNMQKIVKISCDKNAKVSLEIMFKATSKRRIDGRCGYLGQRVGQLGTVDDILICYMLLTSTIFIIILCRTCLLYTSDAADE